MSNLIITIISIALVAVAALMGAYYGGAAFLQGSAKAQANAIINKGQQIASAWITYTAYHGGSAVLAANNASQSTAMASLVPGYLQGTPTNEFAPASPIFSGWVFMYSMDESGSDTVYGIISDSVAAQVSSRETCDVIHKLSAGASATLVSVSAGDPYGVAGVSMVPSNGKFDCFYFSADETFFFVYKAF